MEQKTLEELKCLILEWGKERGFVKPENTYKQLVKLMEESGEIASALLKGKELEVKDGLGDLFVVMVLLAEMQGYDITDCVNYAYTEIADRKGKVVNGTFIKEEV